MDLTALLSAVLLVEFAVIFCIKVLNMGKTSKLWYKEFGIIAVLCDICSVVIGVMIANFLVPKSSVIELAVVCVGVQLVHDALFYLFVIRPLPMGSNAMIDMMKTYANEASYSILIGDAVMLLSSVGLYSILASQSKEVAAFAGVVALYGITYIMYTK